MKKSKEKLSLLSRARTLAYHPTFPWVILSVAILLVFCANLLWVSLEARPPHWDMGRHLWNSLLYYNEFSTHHLLPFLQAYNYYPPLLYWLTSPIYTIFGTSVASAVSVNIVFITILTVSTYLLGKELWGKRVGLLSALLVLSYPMFVSQFKEYQVDAPLAATTTLALYGLVKTGFFRSGRWSIFFGATLGLGLLTKWTLVGIIAIPLAITAGMAFRQAYPSWRMVGFRLRNLILALATAYTASSLWYVANLQQLKIDLLGNNAAQAVREGDPVVGSLASNFWYFWNLINNQLYLIPFLVFILALAVTLRHKEAVKRNLMPLALIFGVYLLFTLISNKDARYTLPMLPAVAIITCSAITYLPQRAKNITTILIGLHAVTAFFVISFGVSFIPKNISFSLGSQPVTVIQQGGYIIGSPTSEQWRQEQIVQLAASTPNRTLQYIGTESIWFNNWGLTYFSQRYGVELTGDQPEVIAIRGDLPPPPSYQQVESYVLPDGSSLKLYRRSNQPYN